LSITIRSRQRRVLVSISRLRRLAARALSMLGGSDRDVHVTVVDDAEIRRLNRRYLGARRRTDVLALDLDLGAGTRASPRPRRAGRTCSAASRARRGSPLSDASSGASRPRPASPGPPRLLGEVIMSADTAARQAAQLGIPVALEMDLLLVHGLLHLMGHDDREPTGARLMHEREYEILSATRRRPVPDRLWMGLLEPRVGATPAPPRKIAERKGRRPIRTAVGPGHRV